MEQRENDEEDHNILAKLPNEMVEIDGFVQRNLTNFVSHVFDHLPDKRVSVGKFFSKDKSENYIKECLDKKR